MSESVVAASPRREQTKQRLLEAAAEVFAEVGMDAASVEDISERAGFTRGAFYSNFASKDELFLTLAEQVIRRRVAAIRDRVAEISCDDGTIAVTPGNAHRLVEEVLVTPSDDRTGVLLMGEIRMRALRIPEVAAAFLEFDTTMRQEVARLIADLSAATNIALRAPVDDVATYMVMVWEGCAVRAAMAQLDDQQLDRTLRAHIATLLRAVVAD